MWIFPILSRKWSPTQIPVLSTKINGENHRGKWSELWWFLSWWKVMTFWHLVIDFLLESDVIGNIFTVLLFQILPVWSNNTQTDERTVQMIVFWRYCIIILWFVRVLSLSVSRVFCINVWYLFSNICSSWSHNFRRWTVETHGFEQLEVGPFFSFNINTFAGCSFN